MSTWGWKSGEQYYGYCQWYYINYLQLCPLIIVSYPIAPNISAVISASLNNAPLMVGQTGFTLTCDVSGTHNLNNPTIAYQWTRNDRTTRTQIGPNPNMFILPSLRLSSAGDYNCHVTVQSFLLSNNITTNSSHRVMIQSELFNHNNNY